MSPGPSESRCKLTSGVKPIRSCSGAYPCAHTQIPQDWFPSHAFQLHQPSMLGPIYFFVHLPNRSYRLAKPVAHSPVFSVQSLLVSGASAGTVTCPQVSPCRLGCLRKGLVHSFSNLYRLPTLCCSGHLGLGTWGRHLPASLLEGLRHTLLGLTPHFSSSFPFSFSPHTRRDARPWRDPRPPVLGPWFRGQVRGAGRKGSRLR